ncbi:Fur family transcriptional regulator [Persicirhabdus sediminis]|uniref:Ferric uptake regulation protein n=1 Tax=Persicirhabdus sediminis TaxID=454144 RepID=A0A8J7SPU6_9BACT|nr:Fur family transcriptional regulator [Persicirhabdus sediminis]MBK1792573.1 transcriptional repressor [Persicirhabdus sediminis]
MDSRIEERLSEFIRSKGLRNTPQRNAVVDAIFSEDEHFTADELWERIRKTSLKASRATVYRTISLLVEAGLLHEIDLGGDQKTYDPNFLDSPSHNHLICIDCGEVVEFEDSHIELLTDCITRRLGYRPQKQSLRIEACCDKLRNNGSCPNLLKKRLAAKRIH